MSRGRRALGLVVTGLAVGAVACSGGTGTEVRGTGDQQPVDAAAAERAAGPLLDLAVDLEQQLATASPGSDVAVAPLPVAMSLSQARSGAGGDTAAQLDRVLHTPPGPDGSEQLATGLSSLDRVVDSRAGEQHDATTRTGKVAIDLAQSLWLQKGTTIDRRWLDELAATWGSGVHTTDFRSDPETARKAVNEWVADATNDHIDQLAPRGTIAPSTRILAAGAAYLKAPWVTPFADTETRLGPFRHLDGSVTTTSMMRNPALVDARFGRGDGWTAVDLPYLGRSLWMTVIVPDEGRFTDVEAGLDGARLRALLTRLEPTTLDLSLPKFGFTTDTPLTDALRSLGLTLATDPLAADFSGISSEPLWLTSVLHQTYLAVAEQGTEATATNPKPPATTATTRPRSTTTSTAATSTTAGDGAEPSSTDTSVATSTTTSTATTPTVPSATVVTVDRPFLVLVRDRPTGAALFYGRVLSPNG
jgi:serine protease inhibitor